MMVLDTKTGLLFGALIFILFGCAFLGIVVHLFTSVKKKLKSCTREVYGFVTDLKMEKTTYIHNGHTRHTKVYFPIVKFKPEGSDWLLDVRYNCGSNPPAYEKGAHILIRYNPDNPREFVLPMDTKVHPFVCAMFAGFGICSVVLGVVFGICGLFMAV